MTGTPNPVDAVAAQAAKLEVLDTVQPAPTPAVVPPDPTAVVELAAAKAEILGK